MNYQELFSSVNVTQIIIIEDDFKQIAYKKERFFYDISRMNLQDREIYLDEIASISPTQKDILKEYFLSLDSCFEQIEDWDESIPYGDISSFFEIIGSTNNELKISMEYQYKLFFDDGEKIYRCGSKYGIGMNIPSYFDSLFNQYIRSENRMKSIKIYDDFDASTQALFKKDLESASCDKSIVCIVDNFLNGSKRAAEILKTISDNNSPVRKNIIGCIFSSKEAFEEIDDKMFFEYVEKGNENLLKICIIKSAYNYFISKLKDETISNIGEAFNKAIKNKNIAFFLSQKSSSEGMSEYDVINEWISLLSLSNKDQKIIKELIKLSHIINALEDSEDLPDSDLQLLNTLEAFDYSVNNYYLPIAVGDIFTNSKGEFFVLIGQDCDIVRGKNRNPKNALLELLPAQTKPQSALQKWANDLEKVSIYNFRKSIDESCEILQIKYNNRKYISNEVLSLCCYNPDGKCEISLTKPLTQENIELMPKYMVDYYDDLQKYFTSVKLVKSSLDEDFKRIILSDCPSFLLTIDSFNETPNLLSFDLKRICRLTHSYVFFLYKLYLEYRGRQPFQTINLVRQQDFTFPVCINGNATSFNFSFRAIPSPDKNNIKDWCWIVKKAEIKRLLGAIHKSTMKESPGDEVILSGQEEIIDLIDGQHLTITKAKGKVLFSFT